MRWYWATRATSVAVHGELLGGPAVLGVRDVLRERGMGERQSVDGFGPERRLERDENRVIRVPPSFAGEARAGT